MEWYPGKFFNDAPPEAPYAVLLLNQPLNVRAYEKVVLHASLIVCADGGANQLHKIFQLGKHPFNRFPDAIVGDLDSLEDDVRDFFRDVGESEIVRESEQDSTDFTKALRWLRKHRTRKLADHVDVVVIGGLGGRVDHSFSTIHQMFKALSDTDLLNGDIYLLSDQSLSFVLEKGHNLIRGLALERQEIFQESIGIIPVCGPATISTKGLEWNVRDWKTELGGQISTSNHIKADVVEVEASDRVLFTIELARALCST